MRSDLLRAALQAAVTLLPGGVAAIVIAVVDDEDTLVAVHVRLRVVVPSAACCLLLDELLATARSAPILHLRLWRNGHVSGCIGAVGGLTDGVLRDDEQVTVRVAGA